MAPLNPEAPEFLPTQTHKLQSPPLNFPFSICTPQPYYLGLFPTSHPQLLYYPPTTTLPPPSIPFHDASLTKPSPKPQPEHNPNPLDSHAVQIQHIKDDHQVTVQKQKQVFKAFISCGRRSDGFRLRPYMWRRKVEQHNNVPQHDHNKKSGHFRNTRRVDEQYFSAFPNRKRCGPLLPVCDDGDQTTVMIRNIPSKYSRDMLVDFLENHCMVVNRRDKEAGKGEEHDILAFDFVYLPIDFKSGLNKGYAFVNFTKPKAAWKFLMTASNMKWSLFQSHKIREVVAARLQGKEILEGHFETMNFPCESEDVLPMCFSPPRDGVTKGKQRTLGKLMIK